MRTALVFLAALLLTLTACNAKPSEAECRKAIDNINKIVGVENTANIERDIEINVRRCRAEWSRKSVKCMQTKTTPEGLAECEGGKPATK